MSYTTVTITCPVRGCEKSIRAYVPTTKESWVQFEDHGCVDEGEWSDEDFEEGDRRAWAAKEE
jgi:hypothetical protein